jgi:hypothetical protein
MTEAMTSAFGDRPMIYLLQILKNKKHLEYLRQATQFETAVSSNAMVDVPLEFDL